MAIVYGAYATLVAAALVLYATPSIDLRTLAIVSILGPFTMMRPWVIAAGALHGVAGAAGAARPLTAALALLAAAAVAAIERLLGRAWRRGPAIPL